MILSFSAVVILTTAIAGLPAIWLIRGQLEQQAWSQVEQGRRAAQTLYAAHQSEIGSKATLIAQRPTLQELLTREDLIGLVAYMKTLQSSAGFDLLLICDTNNQVVASTIELLTENLCEARSNDAYQVIYENLSVPQIWLSDSEPIRIDDKPFGEVIVGERLGDEFATKLRAQTGLEHILLLDKQPVATSFETGLEDLAGISQQLSIPQTSSEVLLSTFERDGQPYYAARQPLGAPNLEFEVALPVADIVATQTRLFWILIGSMLFGAFLGAILSIFLSRRISRPLVNLAETATNFSKGDLSSPVMIDASIREVTLVSHALEDARVDLLRSMDDLRQERDWSKHLLASIIEGIVTLDHRGRITYFSHAAERITGWGRNQVLNQPCDKVFRPAESESPFSQFIPQPGKHIRLLVDMASGHQATLSITGARLAPSEVGEAEVALVFRDVSEEEAIHRLLGHFIANIAHEFRTPLSALDASIELLIDQTPSLSQAEIEELLRSLHLGILRLDTLIDNLLEGANIETGHFRVSPRPYDLGKIIAEAVNTMQPLLDKYGQQIIVELPVDIPVVYVDPRRTVQVFVNLLSNASKYGPPDNDISICATSEREWVRIEIADRGPGIPPDQQEAVFQRFVYPGSTDNNIKTGVGLGLSIVKAVVEAYGGSLGVYNHPNGGAVFWFELPKVK
jgi:PAS domain S-box-containing protein